jgi:hypothetical protein
VFERLSEALDEDRVSLDDLERLLATDEDGTKRRRTTASVLYALGGVVVFGGLALAYGTVYGDLPSLAQLITPFSFLCVRLPHALFLHGARIRRGRLTLRDSSGTPRWSAPSPRSQPRLAGRTPAMAPPR